MPGEVVDDVSEPWESRELVDRSSAMRWAAEHFWGILAKK